MPQILKALCFALPLLFCVLHAGATFGQADPKAEARAHFEKGLAAFDARRLDVAAAEFHAAYRLAPAFVVLYNIGQVNVALGRPVDALQAFTQYLEQGGQQIPLARQREVRAEIEAQLARIGRLAIFARPEGAEVRVDGQLLGETPLRQPAHLAAGKHSIQVALATYVTEVREVDVASGQQLEVQIELAPAPPPAPPPAALPAPLPVQAARSVSSLRNDGADRQPGNGQKIAGYVLGSAGIVATGIGIALALTAVSQGNSAMQRLENAETGPAWDDAKSDYDSAKNRNRVGWIVAGCGVATAIAGAVLVVTSPAPAVGDHRLHVALTPWLLPAAAGLNARSSW